MTDQEMIENARLAGYKKRHLGDPAGTHTICRHGVIEENGKKKHKCIRYALIKADRSTGLTAGVNVV